MSRVTTIQCQLRRITVLQSRRVLVDGGRNEHVEISNKRVASCTRADFLFLLFPNDLKILRWA
jgi:hypothetical protein